MICQIKCVFVSSSCYHPLQVTLGVETEVFATVQGFFSIMHTVALCEDTQTVVAVM